MATKNLLVDWMNKKKDKLTGFLSDVQDIANKVSATNATEVNTPNTPITVTRPEFNKGTFNMQQGKLEEPPTPTLPDVPMISSNNPYLLENRASDPNSNLLLIQSEQLVSQPGEQNNGVQDTFFNKTPEEIQGKSMKKMLNGEYMYIPTQADEAEKKNREEEKRYKSESEVLMDFQGDVLKNKGKMTEQQMRDRYPEYADKIDVLKELQKELRPIIQSGKGVDVDQIAQYYPELLKPKEIKDLEEVKKKSEKANKDIQAVTNKVDKVLKTNWEGLSSNGIKFARDWNELSNAIKVARNDIGILGGANDAEVLDYLIKNYPEIKKIYKEAISLELTEWDKSMLTLKGADTKKRLAANLMSDLISATSSDLQFKPSDEEIESTIAEKMSSEKGKEKLENDFWKQTGKKIATEIGVPLDSLEKFFYRLSKDIANLGADYAEKKYFNMSKEDWEKELGFPLTDEQYNAIIQSIQPIPNEQKDTRKQEVLRFQEGVNKEYESRKSKNLDPDIENYANNRSMTRALLEGDLKGFTYKGAGEAAQNVDMPIIIAAGVVAPEAVLPLMAVDSYSRESQESFEELMEVQTRMGIPQSEAYDNAQEGSIIVGLASATVELTLEKLLGGVETTASNYIREIFMKDFTKRASEMIAERGLVEILKQGAVDQFKSSLEEGLEEVLQQAIHNKAIQQYDPDQKITEGMLEAFEGGFYNPMNLLAGGGEIYSNINQNSESLKQSAYQTAREAGAWAGRKTDSIKNMLKSKNKVTNQNIDNGGPDNGGPGGAAGGTIVPTQTNNTENNGAIELKDDNTISEKKDTNIKEGGLGEKILEELNGLDENTRERIKKNPYSVEESKNLIKEMDENPGIDFRDYQNGRYEDVLDTVLKKLEQKENKRSKDIGTLYDKLEEANAPVDVTELKNKVAEFQAQAEALEDIATPAEQAQIKTILENIEKIGDGTMDVWKVRKIADKRSKRSASSSYDGIGLIWDIRDAIDDVIVKGNPDMKEVDKSYSKVLKEIGEIKGKLFYKNGGLKSNAVSTIKNMMSAGNRIDLNNLEKYIPGIKKQLQAIDDSKFVYNAYTTGKGSRFISGIARGVFGNIGKAIGFFTGGWGGLVAGAVVDAGVDTALVKLTRKALRDTITKETAASRAELERISKKIEEGEKLDAEDKARLKELGEKIKRNGEQMAKTKAEKEAWIKMMDENITPQTTEEEQEKNKVTKKKTTKKNKVTEKNNEAKNKVTKKEPVKKAETTEKKAETPKTETKQEENQTSEHFSYKDYGEFMKKYEAAEKEINDRLDKQMDKERAEKMERFNELTKKEDKTDAEGNEMMKLAGELNNMSNKYERLLEQEMEKRHPDLLKEKEKQQKMFDKGWAEMWERKMAEMNKPYKELYDKYMGEIKKIIGFDENEELTKEIYDKLELSDEQRAEVKRLEEERQKEYDKVHEEKVKEGPLYKEMHKDEEQTKAEPKKESKSKVTNTKNKVTTEKVETAQPKTETKTEDNSDLREKIGDRFYNYLKEQADRINKGRKTLAPVTIEELLTAGPYHDSTKYIDIYERDVRNKLDNIMYQIGKLDLPEVKLTEEQGNQLYEASALNGDRDILRIKWMKEWIDKNPSKASEKLTELTNEGADMVEQLEKAKAYVAEIEKTQKNKETKATTTPKNKVTNPSKVKESGLFNENEVDKGRESEGLNPDAMPLSDLKEMKRLGFNGYNSLWDALRKEDLKDYMSSRIANELVGDYDEIYEDESEEGIERDEKWQYVASDVIDMYEAYEEYLDMKNGTDTFDENTLKNTLESANDYANKVFKGKTAKEIIDEYTSKYKSDLELYNRLSKAYPIDTMGNINLNELGEQGKSLRELANQDNETAQDIDYQELAERENETAQIPTIFEEDLEQMNLRELEENETPQANEEEMNKVTKKQPERPKNLVTSKVEENNNTDSKAEQIFNTSMEQLKKAKTVSMGALGKVKQTEVKLDNGTTITYIDSSVGKGISQNAIIRVNSPEAGYKTYVVTKIPNNPAEIREGGNVLTDEQVDKVYDILQGKNGEVKVEDMKVDVENVEDKKDPITAFLDNNEAIKNDPKLKYKYLSRLNDQTSWIDYSTDIRYNGTVAEKVQQTIDSFGKLSNGTRLPIKFSKNNYGNYIEVGDWKTGLASRNIGDDIEFEYAKFLYDNPEIRSTKEIKADGLKEAIKKGNEIHKEVVKDAEEQKAGTPLDPEKYIRQQPTADEGIEAVYNETKKISDYFEARKESEKAGNPYGYGTEYREKVKAAQDALWRKLKFKSDRSKLYQDFVKNIRESNGNEKQLRSIAKNLYIQKVKDDFKNNYNYPTEVTDKVPGLRTAKDNYDRYLKGRDTSFSGKDPRIDYSDKDRIGAGIKRQDGNQITAEQRREIVNGVLEYAKYMGIDMKKMSEDAGVTYVHLNGKHPFLTSKAVGLFHGTFKSISVGADMESYREKMGQSKDAKTETHTVPVVMAHEITHAIDSMFEWSLFSEQKTREMGRKMNEGRSLGAYWHSKEEITARMVEEYVDVMKGGKGYYNMRGYWNKDVFDNEIKPYVEQIFNEKFDGYRLSDKEREAIKLYEAPKSNNSVTATDLNKVTSK